jgi:hypothetical protein
MGFSIDEIGDVLPNYDNSKYLEKVLKKEGKGNSNGDCGRTGANRKTYG